jgi:hypothetical protein
MGWFILAQVLSILITIVRIGRVSEQEKDLEILILRQQLAILQRKQEKPVKPNRAEKMMLAVLNAKLKAMRQQPTEKLRGIIRIFHPETVLGWRHELVRRKWSYAHRNKGGRPVVCKNLILNCRSSSDEVFAPYGLDQSRHEEILDIILANIR